LYSEDQIAGLISAAFIFKESLWLQMPKKVSLLGDPKKAAAAIALVKELLI
jgi:hypothetical protein